MQVKEVIGHEGDASGDATQETVKMEPVGPAGNYGEDGLDEDNTFAKFTPSGSVELLVCNPDLLGKIEEGDTFYVDFTKV